MSFMVNSSGKVMGLKEPQCSQEASAPLPSLPVSITVIVQLTLVSPRPPQVPPGLLDTKRGALCSVLLVGGMLGKSPLWVSSQPGRNATQTS